jgi:hypothetical protein
MMKKSEGKEEVDEKQQAWKNALVSNFEFQPE